MFNGMGIIMEYFIPLQMFSECLSAKRWKSISMIHRLPLGITHPHHIAKKITTYSPLPEHTVIKRAVSQHS